MKGCCSSAYRREGGREGGREGWISTRTTIIRFTQGKIFEHGVFTQGAVVAEPVIVDEGLLF